jgi:hypothetical protein
VLTILKLYVPVASEVGGMKRRTVISAGDERERAPIAADRIQRSYEADSNSPMGRTAYLPAAFPPSASYQVGSAV